MTKSNNTLPGLKAAIKRAGYTQKTLAEELGLAVSTVARWSIGEQEPSISTAWKLSKILNCSIDELLGIDDSSNNCKVHTTRKDGKIIITIEIPEHE